jgi:hypothetical protein
MPLTEPYSVILDLFDPRDDNSSFAVSKGNLRYDADADGTDDTHLVWDVAYTHSESLLRARLKDEPNDFLLVFSDPSTKKIPPRGPPVAYEHSVTVEAVAIDQHSVTGFAVKVVGKAAQEIRRVIRVNPLGSMRTSEEERENPIRVGSQMVWSRPIEILYTQYVTFYPWTYSATYDVATRGYTGYLYEIRHGPRVGAGGP